MVWHDFKRDRRKEERNHKIVGGLPSRDKRHNLKKAHGETSGSFIGFMDDLTPCRVKKSTPDKPWFRLNKPFMDIKKNRCFSGPPSQKGYCASDLETAKRLFFWYALARTFLQHPYPMWVDADDIWEPTIPEKLEKRVFQTAFAIGYAENECIEARFPANNPVKGVPELTVNNPMTPLNPDSFWLKTMEPYCADNSPAIVISLAKAVDKLFTDWKKLLRGRTELPLSGKPYLLDDKSVKVGAGIAQIRAYADEAEDETLLADWSQIQELLKAAKSEFFELVTARAGLAYFGSPKKPALPTFAIPDTTKAGRVLA